MFKVRSLACASLVATSILGVAGSARAIDLTDLDNKPIKLDVTETSIWAQHFQARTGEHEYDQGYADWLNRLNVALSWWRFTVGLRLDSAVYANRPANQPSCPSFWPCLTPTDLKSYYSDFVVDNTSRYRNSIYPAKIWASYNAPGLEITFGDAYVQFGRGLVLSMRKIDELGLDTTVRGGKLAWQSDPFSFTFVAGIANPSRVDEATGRALFLPEPTPPMPGAPASTPPPPGSTTSLPLFGSDRIIGADIQAGRGLPITLSTHAVRFTRCSPVAYVPNTRDVDDSTFSAPLGSCAPLDTEAWLSSLPTGYGPLLNASEIDMVGQGVEIPSLWGHGKLYVEAAGQRSYHDPYLSEAATLNAKSNGNAVYGSLSVDAGPVTNTLEVKSFRNFYAVPGAVDVSRAIEFGNIVYSIPPTTETITQDSELGFFGACVNGGRLRSNIRVSPDVLVYGAGAYYHSQSETGAGTGCDSTGHTLVPTGTPIAAAQTYVGDALGGVEIFFDDHLSHLFASLGARNDLTGLGDPEYQELHAEYAFTKHLTGPYSLEVTGRHRRRFEHQFNALPTSPNGVPWNEGENDFALKVSPKYVFSQGFEYTTLQGYPVTYFNGSARYNFRSDSSIVLFVGEQRGGLKCVSGVCRVFPAFEGARLELTVRF